MATPSMSAIRAFRPRSLRPDLSSRYRLLQRRTESTISSPNLPTPPTQPPTSPSFFRRNRSRILWGTLAFTLGVGGGQFVVHTFAPPPLPVAGTREDGILMADLNQRIEEEFKIKILRGKCLGVPKQLKGEEGGWVEVVPLPAELNSEGHGEKGLVSRMQGAGGLGVERLFWDRGEKKLVAVIWFGGSLSGWPGVTHGGAIATALEEKFSLAAALAGHTDSNVVAAARPQRMPGTGNHAKMSAPATTPAEPAQLSLSYAAPTYANSFYVIRVQPAIPHEAGSGTLEPSGGADFEATLETMDGKTCVKARAKFAPSTAVQQMEAKVAAGAKRSYEDFKEWMWPSRQKQSQAR